MNQTEGRVRIQDVLIYCYYLENMILECSSGFEVMFHFQHVQFYFKGCIE
jgi:hypothetical protein